MNTLFSLSYTTGFKVTSGPSRKRSLVEQSATEGIESNDESSDCENSQEAQETTPQDDAVLYNLMASAAVDLSDAYEHHGILSVTRSVRDIDGNKRRKYLYNIPIPQEQGFFPFSIPPTELSQEIKARIPSPSGEKLLILKSISHSKESKPKQVFEIWTRTAECLTRRIELPPKLHGKIINNPTGMGSLSWNSDETAVVYSAERVAPKVTGYFDSDETGQDSFVGDEFVLGRGKEEQWGEKYTEMAGLLDLFLLHVPTGTVRKIENVPGEGDETTTLGGYVLGQASFSPCGTHVIYTAWDAGAGDEMPRRLGLVYCLQRPSKIFASSVRVLMNSMRKQESFDTSDEDPICLTPDSRMSRSPRFSPTKNGISKLVFLSSSHGFDTHNGGVALKVMDWSMTNEKAEGKERIWVDEVLDPPTVNEENPIQVANMCFPGLYVSELPLECCTEDYLLTTTQWGSVQKVVRVSLLDGSLSLVNVDIVRWNGGTTEALASQQVLCVTPRGGAVIAESAPNRPTIIGYVSPETIARENVSKKIEGTLVSEMGPISASQFSPTAEREIIQKLNFSYDVLTMRPPLIDEEVETPVQWILLRPSRRSLKRGGPLPPLIVVPHGGPHSCTSTSYNPAYAFLCAAGYAVLHVNYRGSTGFGQRALEALPGNVGKLDVKDVIHATMTMADSGWIDKDRVAICGGSHGGFLTSHSLGQFPDVFKAAAMRNPVTNIATMTTATDIPDWCFVETLGCGYYNWTKFRGATKDELEQMWDASPIRYTENIRVPTLVALGMADKRVPPSQGLELYHTLRSKGLTVKLLQYPKDDHAIDKVKSEADHWINVKRWFDEHL